MVTTFIMMVRSTDSVTYKALYRLVPDVRYETQEIEKEQNMYIDEMSSCDDSKFNVSSVKKWGVEYEDEMG